MTDLTELKRLAEAATPGPWTTYDEDLRGGKFYCVCRPESEARDVEYCETIDIHERDNGKNDCAYIAAANPTAILSLIQRVEEAESDAAFLNELYATPIDILQERAHAEGRLAGIEEAAKVADAERSAGWHDAPQMESEWDGAAKAIAQSIRALKEKAE